MCDLYFSDGIDVPSNDRSLTPLLKAEQVECEGDVTLLLKRLIGRGLQEWAATVEELIKYVSLK